MLPADSRGPSFEFKLNQKRKKKKGQETIHNKSTVSSISLLFFFFRCIWGKEALQTLGANNWVFDFVSHVNSLLLLRALAFGRGQAQRPYCVITGTWTLCVLVWLSLFPVVLILPIFSFSFFSLLRAFFIVWSVARIRHKPWRHICFAGCSLFFLLFFTFSLAYGVRNQAFDGFASSLFDPRKQISFGSMKNEAKRERERVYKERKG